MPGDYRDRNTAIALLSLGYDDKAYEILCLLPQSAANEYLKAIALARLGEKQKGRACYRRACELNEDMEYRGALDPEISNLNEQ